MSGQCNIGPVRQLGVKEKIGPMRADGDT